MKIFSQTKWVGLFLDSISLCEFLSLFNEVYDLGQEEMKTCRKLFMTKYMGDDSFEVDEMAIYKKLFYM